MSQYIDNAINKLSSDMVESPVEVEKDVPPKGGLSVLMLIAMLSMLAYHIGSRYNAKTEIILYDYPYILMLINGLFIPITAFVAVEAYHRTKSLKRYMLELFILGIISILPFLWAMDNPKLHQIDEVFGVLLGILAIYLRRSKVGIVVKALLFPLMALVSFFIDLGIPFLIFMIIFDYFYGNVKYQRAGGIILCVGLGALNFFAYPLQYIFYGEYLNFESLWYNITASLYGNAHAISYLIAILLLLFYRGNAGNAKLRWILYIFYPLHLILLLFLMPIR